MDSRTLRRRTAAAVLAASCVIAPAVAVVAPASAATHAVPSVAPVSTTAPTLVFENGRQAAVGYATNVNPGAWDTDGPLTFSYQWRLDGVDVATSDSYTPVVADLGKALTVVVTASNPSGSTAATSDSSTVDKGDIRYLTQPEIQGDPAVGNLLTAFPGTWDVPTATVEIQWYVDNTEVPDATTSTYRVKAADVGLPVSIGIFLRDPDYYSAFNFPSGILVTQGTLTNLTAPHVTGKAVVGKTLTVAPGTWSSTDGVVLGHQWTVAGRPVSGATSSTFVVPASAAGKKIAVVETAGGGAAWAAASAGSTAVSATKAPAKVVLTLASPAKGRLKATVVVTSAVKATGKVVVLIGKVKHTVTLKNGKGVVTVAKLKKGVTKVTATYAGATGIAGGKDTGSVRVK